MTASRSPTGETVDGEGVAGVERRRCARRRGRCSSSWPSKVPVSRRRRRRGARRHAPTRDEHDADDGRRWSRHDGRLGRAHRRVGGRRSASAASAGRRRHATPCPAIDAHDAAVGDPVGERGAVEPPVLVAAGGVGQPRRLAGLRWTSLTRRVLAELALGDGAAVHLVGPVGEAQAADPGVHLGQRACPG